MVFFCHDVELCHLWARKSRERAVSSCGQEGGIMAFVDSMIWIGLLSYILWNWIMAEPWDQIYLSDLLRKPMCKERNQDSVHLSSLLQRLLSCCFLCSSPVDFLLCFWMFSILYVYTHYIYIRVPIKSTNVYIYIGTLSSFSYLSDFSLDVTS